MNNPVQIVHESETQRQFVRLQLPAMVHIGDKRFTVKDLSSGGLAIRDVENNINKGDSLDLTLILPFADFALDIDLKAEIQYVDKKINVAGCRFTNLNTNQISILNHVLKAFMAGDIVDGNDLLNVVARDNFVNVRQHPGNDERTSLDKIKQYSIYGLITLAILALSFFIVSNIMERLFIIKSPQGQVQAQIVEIKNPASGIFETTLRDGTASVAKRQIIAKIKTGMPGNITYVPVISPCDCFITKQHILDGEYQPQDTALFDLIPTENNITIAVKIGIQDARRLQIGSQAIIQISGSSDTVKGKISDISVNDTPLLPGEEPTALVTLQPDQKLSHDFIGRPAFAEFRL